MQNALEKRENALITAHDAFAASVKTAIQNRLTGLKASWELDRKARITKREATYKAFRTEMQTAHTAIRNTKNSTWKVYQADAQGLRSACNGRVGFYDLNCEYSLYKIPSSPLKRKIKKMRTRPRIFLLKIIY
jgi:hypothetical protein